MKTIKNTVNNTKLRVMHVLNTNSFSGAENVAISIVRSLSDSFDLAYVSPDGPIKEKLKKERVQFLPVSGSSMTKKELKRIINEFKPDIIHAHDFRCSVIASLVSGSIPVISHIHCNCPWLKKICINSIVYALSSLKFKKILLVSSSVQDEFVFKKLICSKTQVISNPIDISNIRKKSKEPDVISEESDIIFVGRLSEEKNPTLLIEMVEELKEFIPNIRMAIVGFGPLLKNLQNKTKELQLEDNIKFYGFQENPYGLMKASKILCLPSKWEGFGLVAVESFALGKPVIASPVGGLKILVNDECGYLCESKKQFVDSIYELLMNDSLYEEKHIGALKQSSILEGNNYFGLIRNVYNDICVDSHDFFQKE